MLVVWVLGLQYGEELILNVTVCFEVLGREIYSGILLNITLLVLRTWRGQCREELILNITVCCEGLGRVI